MISAHFSCFWIDWRSSSAILPGIPAFHSNTSKLLSPVCLSISICLSVCVSVYLSIHHPKPPILSGTQLSIPVLSMCIVKGLMLGARDTGKRHWDKLRSKVFIKELLNTMHYQPDNNMAAVLRRAQAPGIRDSKTRTLVEGNRGPCSTSGNLFSHFSESRGFSV